MMSKESTRQRVKFTAVRQSSGDHADHMDVPGRSKIGSKSAKIAKKPASAGTTNMNYLPTPPKSPCPKTVRRGPYRLKSTNKVKIPIESEAPGEPTPTKSQSATDSLPSTFGYTLSKAPEYSNSAAAKKPRRKMKRSSSSHKSNRSPSPRRPQRKANSDRGSVSIQKTPAGMKAHKKSSNTKVLQSTKATHGVQMNKTQILRAEALAKKREEAMKEKMDEIVKLYQLKLKHKGQVPRFTAPYKGTTGPKIPVPLSRNAKLRHQTDVCKRLAVPKVLPTEYKDTTSQPRWNFPSATDHIPSKIPVLAGHQKKIKQPKKTKTIEQTPPPTNNPDKPKCSHKTPSKLPRRNANATTKVSAPKRENRVRIAQSTTIPFQYSTDHPGPEFTYRTTVSDVVFDDTKGIPPLELMPTEGKFAECKQVSSKDAVSALIDFSQERNSDESGDDTSIQELLDFESVGSKVISIQTVATSNELPNPLRVTEKVEDELKVPIFIPLVEDIFESDDVSEEDETAFESVGTLRSSSTLTFDKPNPPRKQVQWHRSINRKVSKHHRSFPQFQDFDPETNTATGPLYYSEVESESETDTTEMSPASSDSSDSWFDADGRPAQDRSPGSDLSFEEDMEHVKVDPRYTRAGVTPPRSSAEVAKRLSPDLFTRGISAREGLLSTDDIRSYRLPTSDPSLYVLSGFLARAELSVSQKPLRLSTSTPDVAAKYHTSDEYDCPISRRSSENQAGVLSDDTECVETPHRGAAQFSPIYEDSEEDTSASIRESFVSQKPLRLSTSKPDVAAKYHTSDAYECLISRRLCENQAGVLSDDTERVEIPSWYKPTTAGRIASTRPFLPERIVVRGAAQFSPVHEDSEEESSASIRESKIGELRTTRPSSAKPLIYRAVSMCSVMPKSPDQPKSPGQLQRKNAVVDLCATRQSNNDLMASSSTSVNRQVGARPKSATIGTRRFSADSSSQRQRRPVPKTPSSEAWTESIPIRSTSGHTDSPVPPSITPPTSTKSGTENTYSEIISDVTTLSFATIYDVKNTTELFVTKTTPSNSSESVRSVGSHQ